MTPTKPRCGAAGYVRKLSQLIGGEGTFDWHHGPLFIDESFANLRAKGGSVGILLPPPCAHPVPLRPWAWSARTCTLSCPPRPLRGR